MAHLKCLNLEADGKGLKKACSEYHVPTDGLFWVGKSVMSAPYHQNFRLFVLLIYYWIECVTEFLALHKIAAFINDGIEEVQFGK